MEIEIQADVDSERWEDKDSRVNLKQTIQAMRAHIYERMIFDWVLILILNFILIFM